MNLTAGFKVLKRISFVVAIFVAVAFVSPQGAKAGIFTNQADLDASVGFAQGSVFDGVGLFTGDDANGDSFIAGSGVFIGNGLDGQNAWILTAGHVLFANPNEPWVSQQFNPSANVGSNLNNFFDVEETFPFPGFANSEGAGGIGNDIGLAKLSAPITNIAAATLFDGPDNGLIGAEFIIAGYGNPGLFGSVGDFDGIRRGGRNTIDSAGRVFGVTTVQDQFFVSDLDRFNSDNPLPLELAGSQNDSGSPWFVEVDGDYQIARIVNGGLANNLNTFAIRTSLYNDFINDTIAANSTAVPEPGAMSLLTLGLIGAAMRRRKKADLPRSCVAPSSRSSTQWHRIATQVMLLCVALLVISSVNPQTAEAGIFRNAPDLNDSVGFAQGSVFDGVGFFIGDVANGGSFIAGSGVFIGNGLDDQNAWVLTAAHVLYDVPFLTCDSMRFNPSADVGGNLTNFFDVEEVFPFPDYFGDVGGGIGNDIGLVKLSAPITSVTAATLFEGPDDALIGAEFITAGYGNPGLFGSVGDFDGIRRGGRNIIESAGASFGVTTVEQQFFVSDFDRFNSENSLALEWQGSMNDSGSPWFVGVNGEYQIAGIVNGALTSNTATFAIRTSLYNDFINDTIAANSTAVPEPGAISLLTLGLIGAAMRRRRRAGLPRSCVAPSFRSSTQTQRPAISSMLLCIALLTISIVNPQTQGDRTLIV